MKIRKNEIGVIKNEIIEEELDGQRWGFIIDLRDVEGKVELRILFDLLIPVDGQKYVFIKSGSFYTIYEIDLGSLARNLEFLETITQQSMIHTIRMFQQRHLQYSNMNIGIFNKKHFREEIVRQLTEKGVLKSNMKILGLQFTVNIKDLPLIRVIVQSPYNQVETIALIKEQEHKNYISRKLWQELKLKEVKPEIIIADVKLNHERSPTLTLGMEVNDKETNELYPIVIGTEALASLGIQVDLYLIHKKMSISIPISSPISEN